MRPARARVVRAVLEPEAGRSLVHDLLLGEFVPSLPDLLQLHLFALN